MKTPSDMIEGTIHDTNNYGRIVVVEYISAKKVNVRFTSTGFCVQVYSDQIRNGTIKDNLKPSILGVGFIGVGEFKATKNDKITIAYQTWRNMLERCYSHKCQEKHPTYIGCSVCDEWHDFQNFASWFHKNHVTGYTIDKDIKVKGNKLYSPNTCCFVSQSDNNIEAHAKHYEFISPNGTLTKIYNISEFCRNKEIDQRHMSDVHVGRRKTHKGWSKA